MAAWLAVLLYSMGPAAAAVGACPLARVVPTDPHAHSVVLSKTTQMPRDALVQTRPELPCTAGVGVRLLASNPIYGFHADAPTAGSDVCVPKAVLAPTKDVLWMTRADLQGRHTGQELLPGGQLLGAITDSGDCASGALQFGERSIPLDQLGPLRPIDDATLRAVQAVQSQAAAQLGEVGLETIHWTHTGRVSLPWLAWADLEAQQRTWTREALDTDSRREKAVLGTGAAGAYLYFAGADPIRTDIWGAPDAILALLDSLSTWRAVCLALPQGSETTCPVQLGDISYTSDLRPDPLGHRDHYAGRCVDIRLFRADGSRYEAWWNRPDDRPAFASSAGYSRALTGAFVAHLLAREDVDKVLFNDPGVSAATPARGHDDHLHVRFQPG